MGIEISVWGTGTCVVGKDLSMLILGNELSQGAALKNVHGNIKWENYCILYTPLDANTELTTKPH